MHRPLVPCALLALALWGCDCDGGTTGGGGELTVVESALEFPDTCLAPTAPGAPWPLDSRSLHLRNDGNAALHLNLFEIRPPGQREVFLYEKALIPETLAAGEEWVIPIAFAPRAAGRAQADLAIRGEADEEVVVKLTGSGRGLPPDPRLSMSCKGGAFPTLDACAAEPPVRPRIVFAATPVHAFGELIVTLANAGCPSLLASDLRVATTTPGASPDVFTLGAGQADPVAVAGQGPPGVIRIRFAPRATSDYDGTIVFSTNDPARPEVELDLSGTGTAPLLDVVTASGCAAAGGAVNPRCCDFAPLSGPCDGRFTVRNSGERELEVGAISLATGNPLFAITGKPAPGTKVPARGELPGAIEVSYLPGAMIGSDLLVVESTGGTARAELRGGSPPVLRTEPSTGLDFGAVAVPGGRAVSPLVLRNELTYNRQLDLKVLGLDLTGRGFVLASSAGDQDCTTPFPLPSTVVAGGRTAACVAFEPDPAGGLFEGTLRVRSNDPLNPDPGPAILLYGKAPCGTNPEAVVTSPLGRDCSSCSGANEACVGQGCHRTGAAWLPVTTSPRTLTLSGEASFVTVFGLPGADGRCPELGEDPSQIAKWDWRLVSRPGNSVNAALSASPGFSTARTTVLAFDVAGLYTVRLAVQSRSGLTSPTTDFMVTVTPN